MRRLNGDAGAVAVLVALLALFLFGMAALVVDAGAFYAERRELQNGADAAALAIAADCAAGLAACGDDDATAKLYADANAAASADRVSGVSAVCGSPAPLTACSAVLTDEQLDLLLAAVGTSTKYVHVRTVTDDGDGGDEVPWVFGRVLSDEDDGTTVRAAATVVWGAPAGLESAVPVTMSVCEWEEFTGDGTALAPAPDYEAHPDRGYATTWLTSSAGGKAYERVFYTHDASGTPTGASAVCPSTPPGGDAAGSFGWLGDKTDTACSVDTTVNDDGEPGYENKPGNTVPAECKKADFPLPGDVVYLPVYDYFTVKGTVSGKGGGQEVWYHVAGYAAFYVTGYNVQLPGGTDQPSIVTGKAPCSGDKRCISGFFTQGLAPSSGAVGGGPSYGADITQLVS